MTETKRSLAELALKQSIDVRLDNELGLNGPLSIYDLCERLKVSVRFVDVSMEGLYIKGNSPKIWVSSQRPISRRAFTAAHELGHHIFGHGSTIDELTKTSETPTFEPEEFLVDAFAGFLLMPIIAIKRAFVIRGWKIDKATPDQFYTIACAFGVGYETLLSHLAFSLHLISPPQVAMLQKLRLATVRGELLRRVECKEHLIVADKNWLLPTIDAEVGNLILAPEGTRCAKLGLTLEEESERGTLWKAEKPGIFQLQCTEANWSFNVRITKANYAGLSRFRHLEDSDYE